jgi:endonuclease/exonuclease/phosphatase family metal-dependent hydrolase
MRPLLLLAPATLLLLGACPGTDQNLSLPSPDAEPGPPDAAMDAEAGPPVPVLVMNWNTRNFFNDKRDSPEIPEFNSGTTCDPNLTAPCEEVVSAQEYQQKLGQVASVISSISPDVAILEEVENMAVVNDLAAKLGDYPYHDITQGNDPRGIDIAVLSRLPYQLGPSHKDEFFTASTDPSQEKFVYSRDLLEVHFVINGRHLTLLGAHFKAQDGIATSDTKRLAEAEHTRKIATDLLAADPGSASIVLGDFNCTPDSDPMKALAGTSAPLFTSATAGMAASDRWSIVYQGQNLLYDDQILDPVAATLLDAASVAIPHSNADANAASDHDPVQVVYQVQ